MKKICSVLAVLLIMCNLKAQDVKLSSVSLSSGNGPLSSGMLLEVNFLKNNDVINITLGERDLYVFYLKSTLKKKLLIGPCLEYYHGIPTVSGMAIFSPLKNWSTFSWLGYSAGKPDMKVEIAKWQFLFFYQSLDFSYKRFSACAAILYFNDWMKLVDFKYTQPITKNINFFTSTGYNFFGDGTALLKLGITYKL